MKIAFLALAVAASGLAAGREFSAHANLAFSAMHETLAFTSPSVRVALMSLIDIEDVGSRLVTVDTVVGNPNEITSVGSRLLTVYKGEDNATAIESVGSRLVTVYKVDQNPDLIEFVGSRLVTVQYDPFRNEDVSTRMFTMDGTMAMTLRVNFTGLADPGMSPTQVEVDIYNNDVPEAIIATHTATLVNGEVTLLAPTRQLLKVRVRQQGTWLGMRLPADTRATAPTLTFDLLNGDVDGSNLVDIADYARLAAAFSSVPSSEHWDASADLNRDEIVDIADYSILAGNFSKVGD